MTTTLTRFIASAARRVCVALATCVLLSCGAKTGLLVPCELPLEPATPRVILVLEHSAFFGRVIGNGPPPNFFPRVSFGPLVASLGRALPALDRDTELALYVFPQVGVDLLLRDGHCSLEAAARVDFQRDASAPIMTLLHQWITDEGYFTDVNAAPVGATPAFAALQRARGQLDATPAGQPRFVVLVTGSNAQCNQDIPPEECDCPIRPPVTPCVSPGRPDLSLCLDCRRVFQAVASMRDEGIPTLVIGESFFADVPAYNAYLDPLAQPGGLGRRGAAHAWYAAEETDVLVAALESTIVAAGLCRLHVRDGPPRDPSAYALEARGVGPGVGPVVRDPGHNDGWDWTDAARARRDRPVRPRV